MCMLCYIVWSENYDSGISILDEQQRSLVSIINTYFFHKAETGIDTNMCLLPITNMFKYQVKIHFMTLEQMLLQSEYDNMEGFYAHQYEVFGSIKREERACRIHEDADGLLEFLKKYWLGHAQRTSHLYARHLMPLYGPDPWYSLQPAPPGGKSLQATS